MEGFFVKPKDKIKTLKAMGLSELVLPCNEFHIIDKIVGLAVKGKISMDQYLEFSRKTDNTSTFPYMMYEDLCGFFRNLKDYFFDK